MSRRRKYVVPGTEREMQAFKGEAMRNEGYAVNPSRPDDVKFEVAKALGVPLKTEGENGALSTASAGKVGGKIGGTMVREMIRLAQQRIAERDERS